MLLSRAGLELDEIWHRQASLVEMDERLRRLERRAQADGGRENQRAYLTARLRAGHDPTVVGAHAHRHGLHDTIGQELGGENRHQFDLGRHALHYAQTSERAIRDFGPSAPFLERGRHKTDAEHEASRRASEELDSARDALRHNVEHSYRQKHPNLSSFGIFDREHSDNILNTKLDAIKKVGATPHQMLASAHTLTGGGTPKREGDRYQFPTSGPESLEATRKTAAIRRVLPHAKITHSEQPHGLFGWSQPVMNVDIGEHTKETR